MLLNPGYHLLKRIEARLIHSFHSNIIINDKNQKILDNTGYYEKVSDFHNNCDFKKNILIICKSKNEIFGGFTPLCFDDTDGYKKDDESFLFSLNKKRKYQKKSLDCSNSIFHNKRFGPCFCKDLFFIENSMNKVKFSKYESLTKDEYSTYKDWVNKKNCYAFKDYVILDALEIFQITKRPYDFNEININNNNQNNINNIRIDNHNQVNINNNNINRRAQNNVINNNNNNQRQIDNNNHNNNHNNVNNNNLNNRNNMVNNNNVINNNANNNNPHNESFQSGNISTITQNSDGDNIIDLDLNNIHIDNNIDNQETEQNLVEREINRIEEAKNGNRSFRSFKERIDNNSSSRNTS